jgi:hypothetical protein
METFTKLFGSLLVFVYHCFDRIVIRGYLSGLSRPDQVVYFFRQVVGVPAVDKTILSQRTGDYQKWVEAYARNHKIPVQWAEKGVRKEDYVLPHLRRMVKKNAYGVYFVFKSMEQGSTFPLQRSQVPHPRPELSHSGSSAEPLHALLLLLCPRESSRADGDSRGLLFSFPDHLLSQRPLVHGTGAESAQYRLSQT